jgi:hypothetical protein
MIGQALPLADNFWLGDDHTPLSSANFQPFKIMKKQFFHIVNYMPVYFYDL